MPKVKFICKECNGEFEAWSSQKRKFCSNECRHKAHKKFLTGRWKNSKILKCQECGKEFRLQEHRIKIGRGKYCSRECYGKAKSKKIKGKNNPKYIDGRTKRHSICQKCKKKVGRLCAHHKIPVGICKDPLGKSNIITLCYSCHKKEHKG